MQLIERDNGVIKYNKNGCVIKCGCCPMLIITTGWLLVVMTKANVYSVQNGNILHTVESNGNIETILYSRDTNSFLFENMGGQLFIILQICLQFIHLMDLYMLIQFFSYISASFLLGIGGNNIDYDETVIVQNISCWDLLQFFQMSNCVLALAISKQLQINLW